MVELYKLVSGTLTQITGSYVCIVLIFFSLLAETYDINFDHQLLARICSTTKRYNLFEHENVFQIIGIVLATERTIKSFTLIFLDFCLTL